MKRAGTRNIFFFFTWPKGIKTLKREKAQGYLPCVARVISTHLFKECVGITRATRGKYCYRHYIPLLSNYPSF